jgi:hypothetical protein
MKLRHVIAASCYLGTIFFFTLVCLLCSSGPYPVNAEEHFVFCGAILGGLVLSSIGSALCFLAFLLRCARNIMAGD